MLSEKLNEDTIRNTYFDTDDILTLFMAEKEHGIDGMNLKLLIDLLEDIAQFNQADPRMPS